MKSIHVTIVMLSICLILIPSFGQEPDLSVKWIWVEGNSLSQGIERGSANITLSNVGKTQLRLEFVGLHFDWMPNDTYTYGGGSDKINTLNPGQSLTYTIPFGLPKNIASGSYKSYAVIVYYVTKDNEWVKNSVAYSSPQNLEIVPMVVVTVTSTTTLAQPADWTVDFAVLTAFTIVGLALLATFRSARKKREGSAEKSCV